MAELDFSSYPKPQAPTNMLDVVGKLGGLQQQKQAVDQQKLDQANQALGYMTRAMTSIGPDASKEDYLAVGQNAVKMGLVPPQMLNTYVERVNKYDTPGGFNSHGFFNELMTAAAQHGEVLDYHLGRNGGVMNTGQDIVPIRTPQAVGGTIMRTGNPIQIQPPPTTPTVDANGRPSLLGAQAPDVAPGSGAVAYPPPVNSLPVGQPKPVPPMPAGHSNNFGGSVISVEPPKPDVSFTQPVTDKNQGRMVPRGPATGFAPGVKEAEDAAGLASGGLLAQDRASSANFQREIFPLTKAIPLLEQLGTKGVGPGTEIFNNAKSFLLSNLPGLNPDDPAFKSVKSYDELKKYFVDYANTISSGGTNDRLAATFAGNPSVGISQAAAIDVTKAALSLRRMKQAQYQEFEQKNLPASQYAKWAAQRNNELDPRAFGVDFMSKDAKAKLKAQLEKNPKEKRQFEQSLELAHSMHFVTPSAQ